MNEISLEEQLRNIGLGAPPPADDRSSDLGQEDFMTLMIAQFRNQDPFEPLDNGAFLGQLAQFGMVDGVERLNTSFDDLTGTLYSDQALQAANLVGHSVLASSERGYLPEEGNMQGAIELASSAQNVQIDIMDASGQLIKRLDLGEQPAGLVEFQWDGVTDGADGAARASEGNYTIEARAIRGTNVESVETLVSADIESVNLGRFGQGMTLNLVGGELLSMNQVRKIL